MLWGEGGDISCEGQDTGHCLGCSGAGPSADSVSAVTGYRGQVTGCITVSVSYYLDI